MRIDGTGPELSLQGNSREAQQKAKLVAGAKDFEAMMLQNMLKPLKFGEAESTGMSSDETSGGANDTIRGFATEAIGKALASKGGLGIARQIIRQISAEHDAREVKKVGTKVW